MSKQIVVVGGGAGGLELVVKVAKKLKRDANSRVVLIDKNASHIWKPLLHEVATGSLDSHHDETSYRMLARKHGFDFKLGRVTRVDTDSHLVEIAAEHDDNGDEWVEAREISYDELVLSPGSLSNDFGTKGVDEHCVKLDSREQAERFHKLYLKQLHKVNSVAQHDKHRGHGPMHRTLVHAVQRKIEHPGQPAFYKNGTFHEIAHEVTDRRKTRKTDKTAKILVNEVPGFLVPVSSKHIVGDN
ncbi:FAD-dependent oxidoreductase [bacterium]|nr:FAD-dependent oxidoreductase [bacterium]